MNLLKTSTVASIAGRPGFSRQTINRNVFKHFAAGIVAAAVLLSATTASALTKGLDSVSSS